MDGEYLYCQQIPGGDCGMSCAYIDHGNCPNEDAMCPGWATVPPSKEGSGKTKAQYAEGDL